MVAVQVFYFVISTKHYLENLKSQEFEQDLESYLVWIPGHIQIWKFLGMGEGRDYSKIISEASKDSENIIRL
jgi:hypothetical protein